MRDQLPGTRAAYLADPVLAGLAVEFDAFVGLNSWTCRGWSPGVRVYQHAGHFPPAELDEVIARLEPAVVSEPGRMLANFVASYG